MINVEFLLCYKQANIQTSNYMPNSKHYHYTTNSKLIRKDKVERAQVHPSAKQLSSGCMLLEPDISPFFKPDG